MVWVCCSVAEPYIGKPRAYPQLHTHTHRICVLVWYVDSLI